MKIKSACTLALFIAMYIQQLTAQIVTKIFSNGIPSIGLGR